MFKKILTTGAVFAASLLMVIGGSSAAMASGGLLDNGSFDQSKFQRNNGAFYPGETIGSWEVNGTNPNTKVLQVWFDGMAGPGATFGAPFPSGNWVRVIGGSISQSFETEPGTTYQLTYESRASGAGPNNNAAGWNGGNVSFVDIDGVRVDTFQAVTNPLFTTRTVNFTASGSTAVISLGNAGGGAVGFDLIDVRKAPINNSPLMIPAIAGGIGIAALAGGSALAINRKNKRAGK